MGIVRLGALVLRWCDFCNLPILRQKNCGICGCETHKVEVTPPGDIRPAFEYDIARLRELVTEQFGGSAGDVLIPDGHLVLLNRAPGLDTIDEIIIDGKVAGSLFFDLKFLKFKVIMRQASAKLIQPYIKKGYICVDDGAAAAISKGGSVLIPGITFVSDGIIQGDEIIILNDHRDVIATGTARMSTEEIRESKRGSAVKPRWYGDYDPILRKSVRVTWNDAVEANNIELNKHEKKAVEFIRKLISRTDKPFVVSFSGGKDSLATLLLVIEAGFKPELLFVNTGLELPETVEYTKNIAKQYKLNLDIENAVADFWNNFDFFGPPGKDFRWCCKTNKLGPASKMIKRKYPAGVLSFIGQRSYESEPRSKKGAIWNNPWVPGQMAASPIQKWTALHVWLYLFSKNAPINPWYNRGLDRIGCFLCPASNLSELDQISKNYEGYKRFHESLKTYAAENGFSDKWINFGLWRWKNPPREILQLLGENEIRKKKSVENLPETGNIDIDDNAEIYSIGADRFISLGGFSDCKGALSLEGVFDFKFDFMNSCRLLNILGEVHVDENARSCNIGKNITLFENGTLSITGPDKRRLLKTLRDVQSIIIRGRDCVECGICSARCPNSSLTADEGLHIDLNSCTHCRKCLGPCAVVDFDRSAEVEF